MDAPWRSWCSFVVVGFIRVRSGGRCVCPLVLGFIRRRWVHEGAPLASPGSFGGVGLMRVRPGAGQVHSGSLYSLGCALEVFTLGVLGVR